MTTEWGRRLGSPVSRWHIQGPDVCAKERKFRRGKRWQHRRLSEGKVSITFLAGRGELNCVSIAAKQEVSLPLLEQISLGEMLRQNQLKQPRSQSAWLAQTQFQSRTFRFSETPGVGLCPEAGQVLVAGGLVHSDLGTRWQICKTGQTGNASKKTSTNVNPSDQLWASWEMLLNSDI